MDKYEIVKEEFIGLMAAYDTYKAGYLTEQQWLEQLHKAGQFADYLITGKLITTVRSAYRG